MHRMPKKRVKITYISSPLLVRACDASEFRSVVQQLTGKDSNKVVQTPHKGNSILMHQSGDLSASEDGNGSCHYNDMSMITSSLEFDEDYFWKELLARSVLPSPCVLV
uniref:VQ domain-containing protein n=1 Tax=Cajanus cajan TaxID=3821 RepID=A0A151RJL9_CAJCA|nr:hypothetical protein KK1_035853 [Cajanus cajan]